MDVDTAEAPAARVPGTLGVAQALAVVAAQAREVLGARWVSATSDAAGGRPVRSSPSPADGRGDRVPDLVLPLEDRAGDRIGVLEVGTGSEGTTPAVHALAGVCARMASVALEHAERYEAERRYADRLSGVIDEAPTAIVEVDRAGIVRLWNQAAEVAFACPAAAAIGQPFAGLGVEPAGAFADLMERAAAGEPSRAVIVAVRRCDGAAVWLECSTAPLFGPQGTVTRVLALCTDVTARRASEVRMAHRALHDGLTGAANRSLFRDRLEGDAARYRRSGGQLAVIFVDLDGFKQVNDEQGHAEGDRVLVAVAARLAAVVREGDTVARMGGDEFAVCCDAMADEREALALAERLAAAVAAPIALADGPHVVTASVGVALSATFGLDPDRLVREADIAMYRAKGRGGGGCEVAGHPDITSTGPSAGRWRPSATQLSDALAHDELRVHYQTAVRVLDGAIVGTEALLRWHRPGSGLLPPSAFVGAAERTGLIVPIGAWALRQACEQVVTWRAANEAVRLRMAVNVSPRQLVEPGLVDIVAEILGATGCPAGALVLEVPEGVLAGHSPAVRRHLRALRALGVRVAVDDFGTGGSALTGLKGWPIDALKLDRSLVAGVDRDAMDRGVAGAALRLAQALGLETVAEGVERTGQLAVLAELGCDVAQGYRIAVPTQADQVRLDPFDLTARRPPPPHG